jgi:hypothetical protein
MGIAGLSQQGKEPHMSRVWGADDEKTFFEV